jgi:acyl-CoA dehydrogenase
MQQGIDEILKNLPNRFLQYLLRVIIFPFGKPFFKPKDNLTHKLARLLMDTTGARYRVSHGAHLAKVEGNMAGVLEDALLKTIAAEPIEKLIKKALQNKEIEGETLLEQAQLALDKKIISEIDLQILLDSETARKNVIAVDDFSTHDLAHLGTPPAARQTYNKIEVACV